MTRNVLLRRADQRRLRPTAAIAAVVAGSFAVWGTAAAQTTGPASTVPPASSDAVSDLVDQAREEGGVLDLTWGQFNTESLFDRWSADFEEIYGFPIEFVNTPVTSQRENLRTAISEFEAGRESSTDIFLATPSNAYAATTGGIAEAFDWEALGGYVAQMLEQSSYASDLDGASVPMYTALFGATFNLDRIEASDVPDNLRDFPALSSDYALGGADLASNLQLLGSPDMWGPDELLPWFEDEWMPRLDGFANCSDMSPITTGEFDVYALDCGKHFSDFANAEGGANLGWKLLDDAAIASFGELVPMVHAPHPATARLFVDYVTSPSAQQILREEAFTDLDYGPDSVVRGVIAEAEARGVELLVANGDYIRSHPELEEELLPQLLEVIGS